MGEIMDTTATGSRVYPISSFEFPTEANECQRRRRHRRNLQPQMLNNGHDIGGW